MIWLFYSIHCLLPASQRKLNHFVKLLSIELCLALGMQKNFKTVLGWYGRMVVTSPLQYVFCRKSDSPSAHISGIYGRMASIFPFQYVFQWKSDSPSARISGIYGRMASIFPFQYVFQWKSDSPSARISEIYGRMASISPLQYVFCWKSSLSSSPDNLLRLSASGYRNTASLWASTLLSVLIPDYRQRVVADASLLPDDGRYAQNFLSAV